MQAAEPPASSNRVLVLAFILYGLLATVLLGVEMPPFQNPDEPAHFLRAAQIAGGHLLATRFAVRGADGSEQITAGGSSDPALMAAFTPFNPLLFHPGTKASLSMWAPGIHWSRVHDLAGFPNTALYPPVFYVPSAIGVRIGRATGLTVLRSLTLSRLLMGVAAVATGALALACAGGGAVWLFAVMTLPMSLSMIASSSQDGLLIACSALAGALLFRAVRSPDTGTADLVWLAVVLALVTTARPPYAGLALLPLAVTRLPLRSRVIATVAVGACIVGWSAITAATSLTNVGASLGADPAAQTAFLARHPLMVFTVAWDTLTFHWRSYADSFVGRLGWLDTALPLAYHKAAWIMLGVAALAAMLGVRGTRFGVGSWLVVAVGVLGSFKLVFAIQYLTWTPPGQATVDGVQGRYFLPLALAATVLLPAIRLGRVSSRLHHTLVLAVAAFPVVTLGIVMRAIVVRYYLD